MKLRFGMVLFFVALLMVLMVGQVSGLLLPATNQKHRHHRHPALCHYGGGRGRSGGSRLLLLQADTAVNAAAVVAAAATTTTQQYSLDDLQVELDAAGLGLCHGILHSCGVRRLSDIQALTGSQIAAMGIDNFDRRSLVRLMEQEDDLMARTTIKKSSTDDSPVRQRVLLNDKATPLRVLSTDVDGAFDRKMAKRFEGAIEQDFEFQVICEENDIFKGRLFTPEQCMQMNRMAEYHAYRQIGTIGAGWTNELYTLTAQHMQCKDIPGMLSTTDHIFRQLQRELYSLFPGRIRRGTIVGESDGEPHLVKYNGKAKGTAMHTDNSEFVYITLNVMLSEDDDFTGGGTYIKAIDKTIQLKQGEMLIHLGDLEHAGMDITSGVRRLLISFFACEWEKEELNAAKPEEARDYKALSSGNL